MKKRIFLFVISIHFLWLFGIFLFPARPVKTPPQKVVVKTKILEQPKKKSSSPKTSKPPIASAPKPKPKPVPVQKKEAPKQTNKPLPKQVEKSSPKLEKARDLLKELESNIAGIESKLKNVPETKPLSFEKVEIEQWEEGESLPQQSYFETISGIFRQSLTLPEVGDVKLSITVQPNGEIAKIESVSSKSDVNLQYLEKTLPHLKLPFPPAGSPLLITVTFQS